MPPVARTDVAGLAGGGSNNEEWIPFDSPVAFASPRKSGQTRGSSRSRGRSREVRRPSSTRSSKSNEGSWMDQPIDADGSWTPVEPPGAVINRERGERAPTPRDRSRSSSRVPPSPRVTREQRQASVEASSTRSNPASSSGESSSISSNERRPTRSSSRPRGRSASRSSSTHQARSKSRSSVRSEPQLVTQETRGRSRSRSHSQSHVDEQRSRSCSQTSNGAPDAPPGSPRGRRPPTNPTRGREPVGSSNPRRERSRSRPRNAVRAQPSPSGQRLPPRPARASRQASDDEEIDANIGRDISFDSPRAQRRPSMGAGRNQFGTMEPMPSRTRVFSTSQPRPSRVHPRILLSATVYHNEATNLWIATINTNQRGVATNPKKASKFLKAFSFPSETEARESAIANAPPKMISFSGCPTCFICMVKFTVFKRASHCRNCGVCICHNCSTFWSSKSVPSTYNLKNLSRVRVCKSCDTISAGFKKALLHGNYENAIGFYGTGNINLRNPFPFKRGERSGELMYPIHCAVEGGNINVVRWLLEEKFCPVRKVGAGNGKKKIGDEPITTSKGRSVLSIAMNGLKVDIIRFLVVDKNISVYETKDLRLSLRALEAVLLALPPQGPTRQAGRDETALPRWDDQNYDDDGEVHDDYSSLDDSNQSGLAGSAKSHHSSAGNSDVCIICYDNPIDCVITPCGHQICCLECGTNMNTCPVCNTSCEFIRIFRP